MLSYSSLRQPLNFTHRCYYKEPIMVSRILLAIALTLLLSCQGDDSPPAVTNDNPPENPEIIQIDLDDNGTIDFKISYGWVEIDGDGPSSSAITAVIHCMDKNELLHKREAPNLFLRDLSNIQDDVESPLVWLNIGFEIVSIYNDLERNWPSIWEVASDENRSSYFIGMKLIDDSESRRGWMELEIDINTGQIEIVRKVIWD